MCDNFINSMHLNAVYQIAVTLLFVIIIILIMLHSIFIWLSALEAALELDCGYFLFAEMLISRIFRLKWIVSVQDNTGNKICNTFSHAETSKYILSVLLR